MSDTTSAKGMDIAPGGENTQYESIDTYNKPHAKTTGLFGDSAGTEASEQALREKSARGEQKAESIRYGGAISEHGFGGETKDTSDSAQQQGYGRIGKYNGAQETTQMREEQGYNEGSGVGA